MPGQKQGKSRSCSGQNSNRPTNKRRVASERWVTNSAKGVFRHLKVHGPLNHRRKGYVKPKPEAVEKFVMGGTKIVDGMLEKTERDGTAKMNVPEKTWLQVKRMVARFLTETG